MKYRSVTYIYFIRSIFVSHWSIISSMTFLHQIVLKMLSEITGLQNIGHWPTYILWVQWLCHTDILSQVCIAFLHQIVFKILSKVTGPQNIGHWPTYIFCRSIFVSHWSIIPSMTFLRQIVFKILSKIAGLWNIGHWPTYISWGQSLCHTDPLYDIHPSNSLEDIRQNHPTMK